MNMKNLQVPKGKIDVVLDTDTYNEIDDQFALVYLLRSPEKLNLKAIYAAPYFNDRSTSPEDGMEKSYEEIYQKKYIFANKILNSVEWWCLHISIKYDVPLSHLDSCPDYTSQ